MMRQKSSQPSDPQSSTAPKPGGRREAAFLVLVAAACGALVFTYAEPLVGSWTPVMLTERLRLGLALACAVLVLVLAVATMARTARRTPELARGGRHRGGVLGFFPRGTDGLAATPLAPTGCTDTLDHTHGDVRVLQAHIRLLEEALAYSEETPEVTAESQPETVAEPCATGADVDAIREEVTREVLLRVRSTVRGLGARTQGEPVATDILARVDAAVDRLAATGDFARPTLREPDLTSASSHQLPDVELSLEIPDEEPMESPVSASVVGMADETEIVLPVPPSLPAPEVRRRRRLRRSMAA